MPKWSILLLLLLGILIIGVAVAYYPGHFLNSHSFQFKFSSVLPQYASSTTTSTPSPAPGPVPTSNCLKKGVAITNSNGSSLPSSNELQELHAAWYYDWNTVPLKGVPSTISFVPLIWGTQDITKAHITLGGQVPIILGFNEPNIPTQSNIPASQAVSLWSQVQVFGARVGAPAIGGDTTNSRAWLTTFMSGVQTNNLTVNFIPIHWYGPPDPTTFLSFVDSVHSQFGLPIWITEFAVRGANYTPAQVLTFMQVVLPALESRPYVERFSWFAGIGVHSSALLPSHLVDSQGNLTAPGQYYASFSESGTALCGQP